MHTDLGPGFGFSSLLSFSMISFVSSTVRSSWNFNNTFKKMDRELVFVIINSEGIVFIKLPFEMFFFLLQPHLGTQSLCRGGFINIHFKMSNTKRHLDSWQAFVGACPMNSQHVALCEFGLISTTRLLTSCSYF